jgi:DNA-binding MarR family transcriptional regulator
MIIDTAKLPGDLAVSTLKVLCHIAEVGHETLTELARLAGISTAAVTGLIDRAEARGWIVRFRVADDRRMVRVELTQRGRELVEGLKPQPTEQA